MIRVVISDFGGVLTNPLMDSFVAYQKETGIPLEALGEAMGAIMEREGEHPLFELEKGLLTEARFNELMGEELEQRLGRVIEFGSFADTYFGYLNPNEEFIAHLRRLKATDVRLALLTNNVREWEDRWRSMLPIDELFETVIDSGFVGTRKPERRIYEITLERIQSREGLEDVVPAECVLVDDIEVNCNAAVDFGFKAIQFLDSSQTIRELDELIDPALA